MKFLMLPSKDSKTGKGHSLDKFWILHPKCKPELCLPYKNLPKFFRTVDLRTGGRRYFEARVISRLVRACLPNSSVPVSCGMSAVCSSRTVPNEYASKINSSMSWFLPLLKASPLWMLTSA